MAIRERKKASKGGIRKNEQKKGKTALSHGHKGTPPYYKEPKGGKEPKRRKSVKFE